MSMPTTPTTPTPGTTTPTTPNPATTTPRTTSPTTDPKTKLMTTASSIPTFNDSVATSFIGAAIVQTFEDEATTFYTTPKVFIIPVIDFYTKTSRDFVVRASIVTNSIEMIEGEPTEMISKEIIIEVGEPLGEPINVGTACVLRTINLIKEIKAACSERGIKVTVKTWITE